MRVFLTLFVACLAVLGSPAGLRDGGVAAALQGFPVSGVTVDPAGGAVPGVTIQLRQGSGPARQTVSDQQGVWKFENVSEGTYEIRASLAGFRTSVMTVALKATALPLLRITLQIGDIAETVVVIGQSADVQRTVDGLSASSSASTATGKAVGGVVGTPPAPPPPAAVVDQARLYRDGLMAMPSTIN